MREIQLQGCLVYICRDICYIVYILLNCFYKHFFTKQFFIVDWSLAFYVILAGFLNVFQYYFCGLIRVRKNTCIIFLVVFLKYQIIIYNDLLIPKIYKGFSKLVQGSRDDNCSWYSDNWLVFRLPRDTGQFHYIINESTIIRTKTRTFTICLAQERQKINVELIPRQPTR